MKTKWKINIDELKDYRFDEEGNLWRMPFNNLGRSYGWRKLKLQYPNRWKIGDGFWSKRQLEGHLVLDENPVEIIIFKEL